jgi:GTP-binding protein
LPGPPRGADWRFAGAAGPGRRAPELGLPEIAFAGRSNVGKSSLINRLTRSARLARTSRTPGRTQQINFFVGRDELALADLPGYGFARVPEAVRASWKRLVESYLESRESLAGVVVIVDARRGLGDDDVALLDYLAHLGRPAIVVASKIDKLKQGERARALAALRRLREDAVAFSAVSGEGERELWERLARLTRVR